MARRIAILLVLLGLAPGLIWRSPIGPERLDQTVSVRRLTLPSRCCAVGPVTVDQAWQITSRNSFFGGYSALLSPAGERLLALSDNGMLLDMPVPRADGTFAARIGAAVTVRPRRKGCCDVESATRDPRSGQIWLAFEGSGAIQRRRADLSMDGEVRPAAMRAWPGNQGAEAMTRLPDGRFILVSEAFGSRWTRRGHPTLVFAGDPQNGADPAAFTFAGFPGYRPTDMAALPDGRVLIVMRRLVWPFPARFAVRLMVADPRGIRASREWPAIDLGEVAPPLPLENYEGLALVPQADGTVTGWLISDDNAAALQRTLLLRLRIDPAKLPRP